MNRTRTGHGPHLAERCVPASRPRPGAPRGRRSRVLLALAALALSACAKQKEAEEPSLTSARRREPSKVLVAPVVQREMVRRLETTTRVESVHQVEVFPQAGGLLTDLLVEEGDPVSLGQVLARIDDRAARIARADAEAALHEARESLPRLALAVSEAEARLQTAQNSKEQAERDHSRNLAISESAEGKPGLLSAKELDVSLLALSTAAGELETARLAKERAVLERKAGDSAVARAELALEQAELDLSYTVITSPLEGVVSQRMVDVGDTLTSGAAAFVLTRPDELRAIFYRPQRELLLFHSGAVAEDGPGTGGLEIVARADGLPDREFRGWIERVSPTVDPDSGNFRVTARIETGADPQRLLPGMLVRLEIVTERHPDALVVPKKAVSREGDQSLVFVVREGKARKLQVAEGFAEDDDIEVSPVAGAVLAAGERVVVVGKDLEDGDEVDVQAAAPEPGEAEGTERDAGELAGDVAGNAMQDASSSDAPTDG